MGKSFFETLNYSLGDEDSSVELGMLGPRVNQVVAVAGSGARVVPLLAQAPSKVICVDISQVQLALAQLRLYALRHLSREDYMGVLGYRPMTSSQRIDAIRSIGLAKVDNQALAPLMEKIAQGKPLIYQGRFERMLEILSKAITFFGLGKARHLLNCLDLDSQKAYLRAGFPANRWKLFILLMGNSAILNSLLYRGAFPKKNRAGTSYSIYRQLFEQLFHRVLARQSFFLQLLLVGQLIYEDGFPIECRPDIYKRAQRAAQASEIIFVCGDVVTYVSRSRNIDFVSLSDVPSFLPPVLASGFLQQIKPGLSPGARVITRGHLRVVSPLLGGYRCLKEVVSDLAFAETTQLWHIDAYEYQ